MATAIAVTSAELVLPPPNRQTPTAYVLTPAGKQPFDAALTEVRMLLEQHEYLIVLCPSRTPVAVRQRLHAVRSILESERIAVFETELPPLGLGVLARQLGQLSIVGFSPGVLASAARLLSHYIYAGALLNSVAKLDRVPVSLKSHAKSWVPGVQFGVVAHPEPQLVKIGGEESLGGPGYATVLTTASGQLTSDWVTGTLARQWRVQGLEGVALPPESPRWWGTGKLIEFAAHIPDIGVLYQLVGSVRRTPCHWCGLEVIGDRCVFCAAPIVPSSENQLGSGAVVVSPGAASPGQRGET
ncbi:hypothetical protein [Streptomyces gobiensis]|uniref:hypothetical protein n=1 Tax=Streptomyces gobiensis TaxID=2875706 RepID=UPI001E328CE9|nr:hypothetical protein [Streptomyces gobiensis]UGY93359.1 hypothetical protein test1122_17655 [Streptomyces gobiensis]